VNNNFASRKEKNTYGALVVQHEGNRSLGSHRHRWEHDIEMDLEGIRREGGDGIRVAEDGGEWPKLLFNTVTKCHVS
jgi:hypothetical protein